MAFWTYMLKCADGRFYVGHTDALEALIASDWQRIHELAVSHEARPSTRSGRTDRCEVATTPSWSRRPRPHPFGATEQCSLTIGQ